MDRFISRIDGPTAAAVLRFLIACWCGLSIGGAVSSSAAQTIQYYGGPVIGQVKVVPVFWNSNVNAQVKANATQFFQDAVNSPWLDRLSAYSTNFSGGTQQTIVRGTAVAGVTLVPSKCASSNPCTMTDSDIQAELAAQIGASKLPSPDSNTAYMIFMPSNVTWTDASGKTSGVQFCAYNSTAGTTGGPPVVYGTIIDTFAGPGAQNCGPNADALQNETALASMVLANAITDPDIGIASSIADPVAWFSTTLGQVGNACSNMDFTITVSGRTWSVNQIFNHFTNSCESAAAPSVTSISPPVGPAAGGTSVTITGSNFTIGSTIVQFGSNRGFGVIFISSTQIRVFSPPGHGIVDVTVTNDVGTSATSAADQFTYRLSSHDFNGDGYGDIAWRNANGDAAIWLMTVNQSGGAQIVSAADYGLIPNSWQLVGQNDFNGDGRVDLLWSNTNGDTTVWLMNGTTVSATPDLGFVGFVGNGWSIVATGDFNGDGYGDILWRNINGDTSVWLMTGTATQVSVLSAIDLGLVPTSWSVARTGDFNGDGKADILWHNANGDTSIWLMTASGTQAQVLSATDFGIVPASWDIAGTGDFNGDGKSDILWHNMNGDTSIWLMTGSGSQVQVSSTADLGFIPTSWNVAITGDFNGDGKSDILWSNTNGDTSIWFMNGTSVSSVSDLGVVPSGWTVQGEGAD